MIIFMKSTQKASINPEVFTRGVEEVITREALEALLKNGKKLRIKHGIDATAPDLHIGHAASLWKLRALQEAGHKAVIILGSFTTQIGDPTGRASARPVLAPALIAKNIASIRRQIERILLTDSRVYEFRKNSEWFGAMKTAEFLRLAAMVTHARLIERDMFQKRIASGKEIMVSELLYPLLQGYDSVAIRSDMTINGSDQLVNERMGRFFQEKLGQRPQVIMALRILPGLDGGAKMSKSLGNYIALNDAPTNMFGKAMRALDALIIPYLEAYTDVRMEEIARWEKELVAGANPRDAKLFFAQVLVRRYWGERRARAAREQFLKMFSSGGKGGAAAAPQARIAHGLWDVIELLIKHFGVNSRAAARRLLQQGAVEIDGEKKMDFLQEVEIRSGQIIRVGKKNMVRVA